MLAGLDPTVSALSLWLMLIIAWLFSQFLLLMSVRLVMNELLLVFVIIEPNYYFRI